MKILPFKMSVLCSAQFLVILLFMGNIVSFSSELDNGKSVLYESQPLLNIPSLTKYPDHSKWDTLLKKYVNDEGDVDYKGFKEDIIELNGYLTLLSNNPPQNNWTKPQLLAYYINLYNAATVRLIIENYPVKSITDIKSAWTKNRISVGSKMLSLDDIEHNILREMDEPRIHFALNCASISCPKLSNKAYTAEKIDEQLDRAAKEFINSDKNEISPSNSKISALFKWYIKDFKVNKEIDLINFINQYSSIKMNPDAKVMFKKYNWDLNDGK